MKKFNLFVLGLVLFNTFLPIEIVSAKARPDEPVFSVLDNEMKTNNPDPSPRFLHCSEASRFGKLARSYCGSCFEYSLGPKK